MATVARVKNFIYVREREDNCQCPKIFNENICSFENYPISLQMCLEITNKYSTKMKEEKKKKEEKKLSNEDLENVNGGGHGRKIFEP